MNSKIIIGIPLSIIATVMVYNYHKAPPVAFENIRGTYTVDNGPLAGCVRLLQPGAGINVAGHIGATDEDTPILTGIVRGKSFEFSYAANGTSGTSTLNVAQPTLTGEWQSEAGEQGAWVWTKTDTPCPAE